MRISRSTLLDLMAIALTIFGFASVTFAGGVATGGGSVCVNPNVNNGNPMLLDLALSNLADLIDNPYTGTRLHDTKVAEATDADLINLHNNRAYQYALSRIQAWEKRANSKYSMALVEEGLKSVQFLITPLRIKPLRGVYLPPGSKCQMSNLHTAILFDNGFLYVSLPEWNSLGLLSQAGLLIHEALRNVQILQQLDGTDADLERLTAKILLPYDGTTQMDAQPFFAKYISSGSNHDVVSADSHFLYPAYMAKICVQLNIAMTKVSMLKNYVPTSDLHTICTTQFFQVNNIIAVTKSLNGISKGLVTAQGKLSPTDPNNDYISSLVGNTSMAAFRTQNVAMARALYKQTDAATGLSGAFDSVSTEVIRLYLNSEPLSYNPTIEARDEQIVQRYIQVQREENEQFLEGRKSL